MVFDTQKEAEEKILELSNAGVLNPYTKLFEVQSIYKPVIEKRVKVEVWDEDTLDPEIPF